MNNPPHPRRPFLLAFIASPYVLGALIPIVQAALLGAAYLRSNYRAGFFDYLCRWDCIHYSEIAAHGYYSPQPGPPESNVSFFPALPVLSRIIPANAPETAVVLLSMIAAAGFWGLFLRFIASQELSPLHRGLLAALALAYPSAFFMVVGFSESLFLLGVIGFVSLTFPPSSALTWRRALLAGVPGALMTASRPLGLPLAIIPAGVCLTFTLAGSRSLRASPLTKLLASGALASLGAAVFFAYCQLKFGQWDLYFVNQRIGWGHQASFAAPFRLENYGLSFKIDDPASVSRASATFSGVAIALVIASWVHRLRAQRRVREPQQVAVFLLTALVLLFLSSAAIGSNRIFLSMARYTLPVFILTVLALGSLSRNDRPPPPHLAVAAIVVSLLLAWIQWLLALRFLSGRWVA